MSIKKLATILGCVFLAIFLGITVLSSMYTVDEQTQAVVETFGKVSSVQTSGLHFKFPFAQNVHKVPVNITQKMSIGYYYDEYDTMQVVEDESRIMTGDDNIVLVDFFIEWKVSDPIAFLYQSDRPTDILKALSQASARNIIGSELVDEVMTTGKDRIQNAIEDRIRETLEEYNIGVQIIDVKIQDAEPPNASVTAAFKAVEDAKLKRDTLITDANTYAERELPSAKAKADKMTQDAEAYYQSRVAMAEGEAARFNSIYAEYAKNPETTRSRMYLEVVEELFPGMNIYINTTDGGVNTLIPAQGFSLGTQKNGG